jgi:streptomycin 3"-adenylyltransferase
VYLYGSAVAGGLRPDSDLDLFGVLSRRLTDAERATLVAKLVPLSWHAERPSDWRPLEVTLVVADEVRPWRYPPRFDFQYGEWLREGLLAGDHQPPTGPHPDVALQVRMVLGGGRPLVGPPAAALLEAPPHADVVRAMLDELPSLLADLDTDTRNVLLTLARVWTTVAIGELLPKDAAADWAILRLPASHRAMLEQARDAYLGGEEPTWEPASVRSAANELVTRISEASALPG